MSKILSRSGVSLADAYNVQGSIAGINDLVSEEVHLSHDMASTMFAERLSSTIRRRATGDILQTINFEQTISDLPSTPTRILGVSLIADADRISFASLAMFDPTSQREFPFWVWDAAFDNAVAVRWDDEGVGPANEFYLRSSGVQGIIPTLILGGDSPQRVPQIILRGGTTTFGAGTVEVILELYIAFAALQGVSSHGLPVPGW